MNTKLTLTVETEHGSESFEHISSLSDHDLMWSEFEIFARKFFTRVLPREESTQDIWPKVEEAV